MDLKYEILKHPNVKYTADGNEKPYVHGSIENSNGSITLDYNIDNKILKNVTEIKDEYILMSEEDIDKYVKEEFKNEE